MPAEGPQARNARLAFLFVCVAAILCATTAPTMPWDLRCARASILPHSPSALLDFVENLLLFLPLGLALGLLRTARWTSVLVAAALSASVEATQFLIPYRLPVWQDLLANTVGTYAGWLLGPSWLGARFDRLQVRVWRAMRKPSPTLSTRAVLGSGGVSFFVLCITPLLNLPSFPGGPYISAGKSASEVPSPLRIGATERSDEHFAGTVDEVRVYSEAISVEDVLRDMSTAVNDADGNSPAQLVAAYGFDTEGDTVWDSSSGGRNGTAEGTTFTRQGRFGGALVFDGKRSEVRVPSSPTLALTERFTLEAWVRPLAGQRDWPAVIQKEGDAYFLYAGAYELDLVPAGGGTFGGSNEDVKPCDSLRPNEWSHLAVTYDGSRLLLFVNGRLAAESTRWIPGTVDSTEISGVEVQPGPIRDPATLERALDEDLRIHIHGTLGHPTNEEAPVFRIRDGQHRTVAMMGIRGDDLVLRHMTIASRLGLPSAEAETWFRDAFREIAPGSELEIEVDGSLSRPNVALNGVSLYGREFTVGRAWSFFMNSSAVSGLVSTVLSFLWIFGLFFPVSLFSKPWSPSLAVLGLLAGALVAVPYFYGISPSPLCEWIGAGSGCLLGWTIRHRLGGAEPSTPNHIDC